jgi:hypothetical protein
LLGPLIQRFCFRIVKCDKVRHPQWPICSSTHFWENEINIFILKVSSFWGQGGMPYSWWIVELWVGTKLVSNRARTKGWWHW